MKNFLSYFYGRSLRFQLLFWFLFISLLPLTWMAYITYHTSKDIILKETEEHLQVTGLKQIRLLNTFFAEKERSVAALVRELISPQLENALELAITQKGKDSKEYLQLVNELKKRLKNSPNFRDYQNFILVDEQTRVILSLNDQLILPGTYLSKTDHSKNHILFELFNYTQQTKKPQLSPLTYFDLSKPPSIFIATPLGENQKNLSGVLMFQIANEALFELVQNFQGVGTTGETLIAFDIDSELIVFSSLYDKKRYPYIYRINPQSDFGKFILKVLKETPSIQYVQDYQGEMTIAVGKKVNPYTNWAIIAKVNQKELFSAVNLIRRFSWLILLVTAIVVTLLAIYVAKKLVTPLVQLTNTTKLMAKGDLSHRVYLPYNNEIGRLGLSFNEMAAQLEHLINHLDALVEKRTKEVEHKNEQLKTTIKELQETQHRMVTQEKLASLGGLTAGIAHEIKNPLNFINNFTELSIDIEENLSSILKEQKNSLKYARNKLVIMKNCLYPE